MEVGGRHWIAAHALRIIHIIHHRDKKSRRKIKAPANISLTREACQDNYWDFLALAKITPTKEPADSASINFDKIFRGPRMLERLSWNEPIGHEMPTIPGNVRWREDWTRAKNRPFPSFGAVITS